MSEQLRQLHDQPPLYNIGKFAARTGLPASTLRYYEGEGLLIPVHRTSAGYRLYGEEQIPQARLIQSLRQAGVSMTDIAAFLHAEQEQRSALLVKWREEASLKLLSVQIARQYLDGIQPGHHDASIHLEYWEVETPMVWIGFQSKESNLLIESEIKEAERIMRQTGYTLKPGSGFVCIRNVENRLLHGEIGFKLDRSPAVDRQLPEHPVRIDLLPPTLFVTLDLHRSTRFSCRPIYEMLRTYGYRPSGDPWERYLPNPDTFTMLIPVVQQAQA